MQFNAEQITIVCICSFDISLWNISCVSGTCLNVTGESFTKTFKEIRSSFQSCLIMTLFQKWNKTQYSSTLGGKEIFHWIKFVEKHPPNALDSNWTNLKNLIYFEISNQDSFRSFLLILVHLKEFLTQILLLRDTFRYLVLQNNSL